MAEGNSQRKMYVKTPLHRSNKLSENVGATVWLKMETAQVSGSFKARGLSNFAQEVGRKLSFLIKIIAFTAGSE